MNRTPPPAQFTIAPATEARVFLLLQGPHGPFFDRLGAMLRSAGATVWRVAFNAGDEHFWSDAAHLIRHADAAEAWPAQLDRILMQRGVTDVVLYGDTRPLHAAAVRAARARGLTLHVFEEGYLRPYWITYERGGSNGHSRLMQIELAQMRRALRGRAGEVRRPPARWGDMRQHKFYGALYHFMVLAANRRYPGFRSHRAESVLEEFRLNLRNLLLSPWHAATRAVEARRVRRSGAPYVLVLMQLEHDASFRAHSDFADMGAFTAQVLDAFAAAAPRHHHIVFKAHPLEDGRSRARLAIAERARALGLQDRVHFIRGGKLASLVAQARAAVTVNSTAAQQALWRGLPVLSLGRSVYGKPGLVSDQTLEGFFASPRRPDARAYAIYRDYLLETSQVTGGFYAKRSRAVALRLVVDMMLAPLDPYETLATDGGTYRQQPGTDEQ